MSESFPPAPDSGGRSFPRGNEPLEPPPLQDASALLFRRYRVIRQLGRGGMGVVLLVHDTALQIPVAMKLIPDQIVPDSGAINDLRQEVLRGMALMHPGIVRSHTFEQDESGAAIVMEYVDGWTLADLKEHQPNRCFDPDQILPWLEPLCEALDYAHSQARIVHRDLKPRNIMLTENGRIKVADFGISATLTDTYSRSTGEGPSSGTPPYMSPQQARGYKPRITDDIYSLGATLYDLLTSKPPFFRGPPHVILNQVLDETAPPLARRREELEVHGREPISAVWEETIAACLGKDPARRPQSAREVLSRLTAPVDRAPASSRRSVRRVIASGIGVALVSASLYELGAFFQLDLALAVLLGRAAPVPLGNRGVQHLLIVCFAFGISWLARRCPRPSQVLTISFVAACEVLVATWVLHLLGIFFSPFASVTAITLASVRGTVARRAPDTTRKTSFTLAKIALAAIAAAELGTAVWLFTDRFSAFNHRAIHGPASTAALTQPGDLSRGASTIDLRDPFEDARSIASTAKNEVPPPKPAPVSSAKLKPERAPETRYQEIILQAKQLRERGDTGAAVVKLRDGMALEPNNPEAIAELALTFEHMGLMDKAAEQWKRIYDMGEAAGFFFIAAESRMKLSQAQVIAAAQAVPSGPVSKLRADAMLGLGDIARQDTNATGAAGTSFTLRVPLNAKAGEKISVTEVDIDVRFYDQLDGKTLVQSTGDTNHRWTTAPIDWADTHTETIEIEYKQDAAPSAGKGDKRRFFGYIVRLYYKGQIQDLRADPATLNANFPTPPTLDQPASGQPISAPATTASFPGADDFARYATKLRDAALTSVKPRVSVLSRTPAPKAAGNKNTAGASGDIQPPFGLGWGETTARLEKMLHDAKATIVAKRAASDGLTAWDVDGILANEVKRTLFYFRDEKLAGVELIYQRDDWQAANYDDFMKTLTTRLQQRYGEGQQTVRKTESINSIVQTVVVHEWNRNSASLSLSYYAAQDGAHVFRTISVRYQN